MSIKGDSGDMNFWIKDKMPMWDVPVPLRALRLARKTAHDMVHEKKTHPSTYQFDQELLELIHKAWKRTMEGYNGSTPTYFSEFNGESGYSSGGGCYHVDGYIHTPPPRVTTYIIHVVNSDWFATIHQVPSDFTGLTSLSSNYSCYLDAEEMDNQVMGCDIFTEHELEELEKRYEK